MAWQNKKPYTKLLQVIKIKHICTNIVTGTY